VKLGIQTTTLDLDPNGQVTETKPFDHVTKESVERILPEFIGKIMQVPPIFSALKKDGKRLHEEARKGKTEEELGIEAREVEIFDLKMLPLKTYTKRLSSLIIFCCLVGRIRPQLLRSLRSTRNESYCVLDRRRKNVSLQEK